MSRVISVSYTHLDVYKRQSYSLSSFGISTLGYLNADENEENAYHIDGDAERCGLRYEGLPIYSYEHLYALSPDTHITVSYTHLDVYKRQGEGFLMAS